MVILLTAIGKRIELIEHLKSRATVIGADCSELNPARYFTDKFYQVPRINDPEYLEILLSICEENKADYLIPLMEPEFELLSANRERFNKIATKLLLSDTNIIRLCKNKADTDAFFKKYGIPSPKTYKEEEITESQYPLVIKPADGMGSENVYVVSSTEDYMCALKKVKNPIIQEKLEGTEYTMDVLCGENGEIIYIVPRVRLEVRAGEVSKSRVELRDDVTDITKRVMEALKKEGNIMGPFTLQCFLCNDGTVRMLEINPRFGGGVPLAFASGADYAAALEDILRKKAPVPNPIKPKTMLRYDRSIFIDN